ncbi:MAG: hypothetical protein R3C49_07655 [Planctomycetaceae bacterium]
MLDIDSNLVLTDRRRRNRRQSASAKSEAADVSSPADSTSGEGTDRRRQDRRRQIDPTTCERDYNGGEVEFMRAMDDYKRRSGRPFPTWSEVLEVLVSLGYRKVAEPTAMEWRTSGE